VAFGEQLTVAPGAVADATVTYPRGENESAGFSTAELVAVVVIVGVILVLAWPAFTNAVAKRDLTRTMNNGRELYLAAFRMATDGTAKSDPSLAWPGDYPANSLAEYCGKLVEKDYLKAADLQRILSAPGAACTVTMGGSPPALTLTGKSALKIYKVKSVDRSNTIFVASSNYVYGTALDANTVPFGDAGFVVVRKSGDAGVYKKDRATPAGYDNDPERFQAEIGALPGAAKGNVVPGDDATALTGP
jgi:type II secretory pathway pseudopilin PulG